MRIYFCFDYPQFPANGRKFKKFNSFTQMYFYSYIICFLFLKNFFIRCSEYFEHEHVWIFPCNLYLFLAVCLGSSTMLKTAFSLLTMDLTGDDTWASTLMRAFLLNTKRVLTFL